LWYIKIDFCIEGVDMKKIFALSFSVIFIFALVVICFAHPGGTDGSGGHYDSSAGEYHYHHGYPAHQHEDGECPYKEGKNKSAFAQVIDGTIDFLKEFSVCYVIILLFAVVVYIVDYFKKKIKNSHYPKR
jgi:hypothetical protein